MASNSTSTLDSAYLGHTFRFIVVTDLQEEVLQCPAQGCLVPIAQSEAAVEVAMTDMRTNSFQGLLIAEGLLGRQFCQILLIQGIILLLCHFWDNDIVLTGLTLRNIYPQGLLFTKRLHEIQQNEECALL